ncbi:MAG: hypothetical protein ABJC89_18975, partial [Acidobacteriota bacterium]
WSPKGDAIYFVSDNGGLLNLWWVGFDSRTGQAIGMARPLTAFSGPALQLLPDIRTLEVGVGGGRAVLPLVQQKGGLWLTERAR